MWTRHFLPLTNSKSVEWLRSFVSQLMTLAVSSNITISFVRAMGLPRPGWDNDLPYLLHYLNVNTIRMKVVDGLDFFYYSGPLSYELRIDDEIVKSWFTIVWPWRHVIVVVPAASHYIYYNIYPCKNWKYLFDLRNELTNDKTKKKLKIQ